MDKEDARYQTLEQLHERRKQVIRLHNKGYGVMTVVELSGLSYPTVRRTIDSYTKGGLQAIAPSDRGRKLGDGRRLTPEQEQQIDNIIRNQTPQEFNIGFPVWTRVAVLELIYQHCGITLSIRGAGNYLKRWGVSTRKIASQSKRGRKKAPEKSDVALTTAVTATHH
jgi:transposase